MDFVLPTDLLNPKWIYDQYFMKQKQRNFFDISSFYEKLRYDPC